MGTYTAQNGIDYVRKFVRDAPVTSIDSQTCDIISSIMWTFYPWRWAQAPLTAIDLVDGTQDYSLEAGDTDFHNLLQARIVKTDTTPDQYQELSVREFLVPDLAKVGWRSMSAVSWVSVTSKLRLNQAIHIASGETLELQGEYWTIPEKIEDADMSTVLVFPDVFFGVFVEGLKWKAYEYIGDNRAGTVIVTKSGQRQYTGQLGVFMGFLERMAEIEDQDGDNSVFPDSSFGAQANSGLSVYGW